MKTLKLICAAAAAVMMTFTALAGNATWQLASGQAFRGDGQACLYQTYTDNDGADWYTVELDDVVSAFVNGTLDLSNPPRRTGYSGASGVKGPADVVDGVFAPQATTLGNMNYWYFSLVALVKVNGQDMLYVSDLNEEGGEGKYTTLLEFSLGTAEYDATGGYKGKGYYRLPAPTAKAVVQDGGTTLKFVYDTAAYGTKGTHWFSVADAEAKAPGYNPPWHDSCYATVTKVVFDSSFAVYRPKHCGCWFADFASLVTIWGLSNLDTSSATSLMNMFRMCSSLASLDVSGFDTSNVTSMNSMFYCCSSLTTLDVSGFNTSNVTSMSYMFGDCSSLTTVDVSGFDTSKVTNMPGMFDGCSSLTTLDVTGFDTAKVTDIRQMFNKCSSLETLDLSGFDTAKVTDMRWMVRSCSSLKAIYASDAFVTTAVTSSNGMFLDCTALVGGAGTAYDSSRTDETYARIDGEGGPGYFTRGYSAKAVMDGATLRFVYDDKKPFGTKGTDWFSVAEAEAQEPGSTPPWWNLRDNVTKVLFDGSFAGYRPGHCAWFLSFAKLATVEGLENLDVSEATSLSMMFSSCESLTSLDLSGFNTAKVTGMNGMFYGCKKLKTILVSDAFTTAAVTASGLMFSNCTALKGGNGTAFDSSKVDKTYARIDGKDGQPGYFTAATVLPEGSYCIHFVANGGTGTMADLICARDKVYNLTKCAFTAPTGKAFKGWAGSNGRRYDDGVLVFNAVEEGETVTMTAIWK